MSGSVDSHGLMTDATSAASSAAAATANAASHWSELQLWQFLCLVQFTYVFVHLAEVLLAYGVDVGAKWALLGKREPGEYPWDASSYCLRWNVYLVACGARRDMLDYLRGSEYCCIFFRRLGAFVGENVCLYPTAVSYTHLTLPTILLV